MEQRLISYTKGITTSPGELLAEDGELLECINLKCENGELKPLLWPEESEFTLGDGEELLFVHKTSNYKNYVVRTESYLLFCHLNDDSEREEYTYKRDLSETEKNEAITITAIGNTLAVSSADGLYYILFKEDDYIDLGDKPPMLNIQFNLASGYNGGEFSLGPLGDKIDNDTVRNACNAVLGKNRSAGFYSFPFFIKYGYIYYDGSYVMHSIPVLMIPNTYMPPFVTILNVNQLWAYVFSRAIEYKIEEIPDSLKNWKDIISGVFICTTEEFFLYDTINSGSYESFNVSFNYDGDTILHKSTNERFNKSYYIGDFYRTYPTKKEYYGKSKYRYIDICSDKHLIANGLTYYFPNSKTIESIDADIRDNNYNFHLVHTIDFEDIKNSTDYIKIDLDVSALGTYPYIPNDTIDNKKLKAGYLMNYNSRLILADVELSNTVYYALKNLLYFFDSGGTAGISYKDSFNKRNIVSVYIEFESEEKEIYYCSFGGKLNGVYGLDEMRYFFYPDKRAKRIIINTDLINGDSKTEQHLTLPLIEHKQWNGAFYFEGFDKDLKFESGYADIGNNKRWHKDSKKIYVSDIDNPLYFRTTSIKTISSGDVIALSTNTTALSQGQFGQFPLLCFTTDGIWALEVGSDGSFSAKQAISREICNNKYNIVQTDDSVYFSTEKGLMRIIGSDVQLVSPQMTGPNTDVNDMKRMGDMSKDFSSNMHGIVKSCSDEKEFVNFLRESRAGYNYREGSIYFSNKDFDYMYVYYISNNAVVKLYNPNDKVVSFVNDYPDTLASGEEKVYSLLTEHDIDGAHNEGFAMTRALKLGNPASLKKIRQLKNLKNVYDKDSAIKCSLWGSNDNINWYPIGNMRGIFKYYRMGLFTRLRPTEGLSGSVIMIEEKRNNKLR